MPLLDREAAQQARAHAARVLDQHPEAFVGLETATGGFGTQAIVTKVTPFRIAGENRYATAAALADEYWVKGFWNPSYGAVPSKFVFLASGHDFPDALSGGAAAAAWGGPLLLTKKSTLPPATADVLKRLKPDTVVILGGTAAVTTEVETALRKNTPGAQIRRFDGANRWAVSANLASHMGESPYAYVANGRNFPDGLSGGAAAGYTLSPLLLTEADSVPTAVTRALKNTVRPTRIYVLGGTSVVSDEAVAQLRKIAPVTRLGGQNRWQVSAKVADQHPTEYVATAANGRNWPDGLAGSALAGLIGGKLLLVEADAIPTKTRETIRKHGLATIDVLGGTSTVQNNVINGLKRIEVTVPE